MQTTGLLILLVQIGFAVHALRRGYPIFWVFLIVFVPVIGCLLYAVVVLLPEFTQSRAALGGVRAIGKALDPGRELRELREALETTDTVGNRAALAEAYVRHGRLDEAIGLYQGSLTGIYRVDPVLLLGLAAAQVEAGQFQSATSTLQTLREAHPDEEKPAARLLMARALEGMGDRDAALMAYANLVETMTGAEAKCRYAQLLKAAGREAQARALFQEILREAKKGTRHSQQLNQAWIESARKALS